MMHWFGNYGYGMGYGWIFMLVFWAAVIYLIVILVKKLSSGERETAEEILKKRYARGEITKEEFDRMKEEIRQ